MCIVTDIYGWLSLYFSACSVLEPGGLPLFWVLNFPTLIYLIYTRKKIMTLLYLVLWDLP